MHVSKRFVKKSLRDILKTDRIGNLVYLSLAEDRVDAISSCDSQVDDPVTLLVVALTIGIQTNLGLVTSQHLCRL